MAYANKVLQMQRLAEAQRADASPAPITKGAEPAEETPPAPKPARQNKKRRRGKK